MTVGGRLFYSVGGGRNDGAADASERDGMGDVALAGLADGNDLFKLIFKTMHDENREININAI